jgi:hypothetical protein
MARTREQKKSATHTNGSSVGSRVLRSWRWLWNDSANNDADSTAHASVSPAKQPDPAETELPLNVAARAPLKLITWLGASAGGLTIFLVAIGFLALSAHDVMLGIPRSIQSNSEYVAVGGLFLGRSIIFLITSFISAKSWIVLLMVSVAAILLFNIPPGRSRGKSIVIAVFSIALLIAEVFGLMWVIRPLQISNLLLKPSTEGSGLIKNVVDAILVKDTTWLGAEYGFLVLLVLAFSIAFILLDRESQNTVVLSRRGRNRTLVWHLARVPAFILLLVCIFLLPRAYGVLTIANDYPVVTIERANSPSGNTTSETHLLLREDDKIFVLYDPSSQSIVTLKRDSVAQHKMYAPQHVFTASVVKK